MIVLLDADGRVISLFQIDNLIMNKFFSLVFLAFTLTHSAIAAEYSILSEAQLSKIVDSPVRFAGDKDRDPDRKPIKVLKFSGIAKGHYVLDIYAGGGWYSELFSKSVGLNGKVFVQNDDLTWRFGKSELIQRTKNNRLPNLIRLDQVSISDINLPDKSIDIAFMGINYHDLFFTDRVRNGKKEIMRESIVDYRASFLNIMRILKDDGVLIVTDHFAKAGSGYKAANELHRIDPNIVKFQLSELGFKLVEEAFYLRNPDDDLSELVFNEGIRGKTDRFIYKFTK